MMARCVALALSLVSVFALADGAPAPDQQSILRTLERGARSSHSDSLLILRDGSVLLDYRPDGRAAVPIELMSVTKSVVALGIGRLLQQGRIASLDIPVTTWYPEWQQGRKQAITLRMLLNQTSGLQNVPNADAEINHAPDVVKLALAAELDAAPGTRFAYNNKAVNLLSGIVEKASGQQLDAFMQSALFQPMGIAAGPWEHDAAGNPHAMSGLPLRASDVAKLGRLVLDQGKWNGQALLSADFVREMLAPADQSGQAGLLWWRQPAWVHLHVTQASFDTLRQAGLPEPYLEKLKPWLGRSFDSPGALLEQFMTLLGQEGKTAYMEHVMAKGIGPYRVFNAEQGPVVAFSASGDLGQFLIVVPQAHLVAVRQIEASHHVGEADGFEDFPDAVLALAKALAPDLGAR